MMNEEKIITDLAERLDMEKPLTREEFRIMVAVGVALANTMPLPTQVMTQLHLMLLSTLRVTEEEAKMEPSDTSYDDVEMDRKTAVEGVKICVEVTQRLSMLNVLDAVRNGGLSVVSHGNNLEEFGVPNERTFKTND